MEKLVAFVLFAILLIQVLNLLITKRRQLNYILKLEEANKKSNNKWIEAENTINLQNLEIKELLRKQAECIQFSSNAFNLLSRIRQSNILSCPLSTGEKKVDIFINTYLQNIVVTKLLEDNQYQFAMEKLLLGKIIKDLKHFTTPLELGGSIVYEINLDASYSIKTDKNILQLVLLNLIFNAFLHSESKEPIKIKIENKNKESLKIYIVDSGIGIPKKHHLSIFNKYFRLKSNTDFVTESAGIGLYLCSLALRNLGAEISVESKVGEGTTFLVTLPVK